jgi:rare lipoprotein A (peptidoglycan hydrolase)
MGAHVAFPGSDGGAPRERSGRRRVARSSLVAYALIVAGCHCGCPEAASAQEWKSDPADYRAAAAPESAGAADADDEASLRRQFAGAPALKVQRGKAAYYGPGLAGNKTASGETFDPERFTAAHRKLPFGTIVRVIRPDTGQHTYVRINDRGPFGSSQRIIDVAEAAARRLDMIRLGVVDVRLEVVRLGDERRARR